MEGSGFRPHVEEGGEGGGAAWTALSLFAVLLTFTHACVSVCVCVCVWGGGGSAVHVVSGPLPMSMSVFLSLCCSLVACKRPSQHCPSMRVRLCVRMQAAFMAHSKWVCALDISVYARVVAGGDDDAAIRSVQGSGEGSGEG